MSNISQYLEEVRVPSDGTKVYKDECAYSFHTPESEGGLYISLNDFIGVSHKYLDVRYSRNHRALYLNIKRTRKRVEKTEGVATGEPPKKKPTILGIGVDGGFDGGIVKEDVEDRFSVYCVPTNTYIPFPDASLPDKVQKSIQGIITAQSASRKDEVKSWVAEKQVAPAAFDLKQKEGVRIPPTGWKCAVVNCDKNTENLWLNLTDGFIACGRRQPDGTGGNGHAQAHFDETFYPLSVKLGTISAEGEADVYSYLEGDMVQDPFLKDHLKHFGIDIEAMKKTEKSMAELELDQNLQFDFSRISEKGKSLVPLFGPGLTGIENLGNSCYMSSVLQMIFSVPDFQKRFYIQHPEKFFRESSKEPPADLETQVVKLAHGLLSGEYSTPIKNSDHFEESQEKDFAEPNQVGIAPKMFKSLIGADHPEFSTFRQQDALEFFQYFLTKIEQHEQTGPNPKGDPTRAFSFVSEERLLDTSANMVRYQYKPDNVLYVPVPLEAATNAKEVKTYEDAQRAKQSNSNSNTAPAANVTDKEEPVRPKIPLSACLEAYAQAEEADFTSPVSKAQVKAHKSVKMATFPDVLVVCVKRFTYGDGWAPKKLDVFIDVPEILDINWMRGKGLQASEKELPDDAVPSDKPDFNEAYVKGLEDMGFPRNRCIKAVLAVKNAGSEQAMEWLFQHMEDADIDAPIVTSKAPAKAPINEESVQMLQAMGFGRGQALQALSKHSNLESAADWLFNNPGVSDAMEVEVADSKAKKDPRTDARDGSGRYGLLGFISHIGTSTASGHYVCHIRKDGKWVLFNDRKVAASEAPPAEMAYMYFYHRL